jgi:hypothetical protein
LLLFYNSDLKRYAWLRISDIPVQIAIPRIESQWIVAHPPSRLRIVEARPVSLQVEFGVFVSAGELVPAKIPGGRRDLVAPGVVGDAGEKRAGVVGDFAHRAEAVLEEPALLTAGGKVREDLVDRVAVFVTKCQRA